MLETHSEKELQRDLILFVDDQLVAQKYFSLMFGDDYEIITASNAEEAWLIVNQQAHRLAIIISDQRMTNQSGVDLLMAVRQAYPRIVRLLTTGYVNIEEAIDAVSRGEIYAYVYKPWNIEEFALDIKRAVELYHLQIERDSLIDMHAGTIMRVLSADRLRAYGIIAATCSGWLERSLEATLAFWLDATKYNNASNDESAEGAAETAVTKQTFNVMACAGKVGAWLAANRNSDGPIVVKITEILTNAALEYDVHVRCPQPAMTIFADTQLLKTGLHSLIHFFGQIIARNGHGSFSVNITILRALTGDVTVEFEFFAAGPNVVDIETELVERECFGLQAYLAFHHHGGSVVIKNWSGNSGLVVASIPVCPPSKNNAPTVLQQSELLNKFSPQM